MQTPPFVRFRNVRKSFGAGSPILDGLDVEIPAGEFVTLLGPSGAGKTTLLLMLAGLERPDAGEILIDGRSTEGVPPHRRGIGAMLANFALFPHLSIAENIAWPLRARGVTRRTREDSVAEAIEMTRMSGLEGRPPGELSVAQRRRAALARALAAKPLLLLLDEPLAGLDGAERDAMRRDISDVQRRLGVTLLYATRDARDAMAMSDRVAVVADGRIRQSGPPRALYERPVDLDVAGLLGEINRLPGVLAAIDEDDPSIAFIDLDCGFHVEAERMDEAAPGARCVVAIRPERIAMAAAAAEDFGADAIPAIVVETSYLGERARVRLSIGGGGGAPASEIVASRPADAAAALKPGEAAAIAWQPGQARVFAAAGR